MPFKVYLLVYLMLYSANCQQYFSAELCPCLTLPESFQTALAAMLDYTLLKDPVFLMIGISNVFGMAGLYVPFVYLVDAAKKGVSNCRLSII